MKKALVYLFLVLGTLILSSTQVIGGEFGHYDYSLHKSAPSTYIDNDVLLSLKISPDYSLNFGSVKPSIRFTPNPSLNFDANTSTNGPLVRTNVSPFFLSAINNEPQPINYAIYDDKKRRQFLENIPFVPYFHFERGDTSAGILFWTDGKVNMFWKTEW